MIKWTVILIAGCILASGCSNAPTSGSAAEDISNTGLSADSVPDKFFPVTYFLQKQLTDFDSLKVTILQESATDKRLDSSWLPIEAVKPLLQPFVADLIDEKNLVPFFKESKFSDQTTETITFTYDPKPNLPDTIRTRHWDVYVDPQSGAVKRIYIVKQLKENGVSYTQQLTWQANKSAKIVLIDNVSGKIQSDKKWIWDFTKNADVQ